MSYSCGLGITCPNTPEVRRTRRTPVGTELLGGVILVYFHPVISCHSFLLTSATCFCHSVCVLQYVEEWSQQRAHTLAKFLDHDGADGLLKVGHTVLLKLFFKLFFFFFVLNPQNCWKMCQIFGLGLLWAANTICCTTVDSIDRSMCEARKEFISAGTHSNFDLQRA